MKKLFNGVKSLLSDERGAVSSKRLVGLICAIILCLTLYRNSFSEHHIAPSDALVNAVAMLCAACLGLTSVDKIWGKKQKSDEPSDNNLENQ